MSAEDELSVSDECIEKYTEMYRNSWAWAYIIFKLNQDRTQIILDQAEPPGKNFDAFVEALVSDDGHCRYGVCEQEFPNEAGVPTIKRLFFLWAPETASAREKIKYAANKDLFMKRLGGIDVEIQANDFSELEFGVVRAKAMAGGRFVPLP